ncbi:MAG: hypothetical protein ACRD1R_10080 [Acidobacteriota bacterium]
MRMSKVVLILGIVLGVAIVLFVLWPEDEEEPAAAGGQQAPTPSGRSPQVRPVDEAALQAFSSRAAEQAELLEEAEDEVPDLDDESEPAEIDAFQRRIKGEVQEKARPERGRFFTPQAALQICRLIENELAGPNGATLRSAIYGDEHRPSFTVKVGQTYPENHALSTVPPALLMKLPKLPEGLEYRFVGKGLILRHDASNLIVDHVPGCLP